MCKHGTLKEVELKKPSKFGRTIIPVDACIAKEIQKIINLGVYTLGCCCGHGLAGQVTEWENDFGKWKGKCDPPNVLISKESVSLATELGYVPFPYYYADGEQRGIWQMQLKTGCLTEDDITKWHNENGMLETNS